jgi:hypothetical protein
MPDYSAKALSRKEYKSTQAVSEDGGHEAAADGHSEGNSHGGH